MKKIIAWTMLAAALAAFGCNTPQMTERDYRADPDRPPPLAKGGNGITPMTNVKTSGVSRLHVDPDRINTDNVYDQARLLETELQDGRRDTAKAGR
jgi:hypothetical protein